MTSRSSLSLALFGIGSMLALSAQATASTLVIRKTCLSHLTITGENGENQFPDGIHLQSGENGDSVFSANDADCSTDHNTATLHVPTGTAITIQQGGKTSYSIQDVNGALSARTGSGDVIVDSVTGLNLSMLGGGDVRIDHATGTMAIHNFSSGDLTIRNSDVSSADINNMASGDIALDGGKIASLNARSYGSGDINAQISARDAALASFSSGDLHIDTVTGTLTKSSFGSGDITASNTNGAHVTTSHHPDGARITSDTIGAMTSAVGLGPIWDNDDSDEAPTTHTSHTEHHGPVHYIFMGLIIWGVISLVRRHRRKTGEPISAIPQRVWDDASAGYASFVQNWEHRMAEQRSNASEAHTPPHIYYTRRAVDLWAEVTHTAREQRNIHRNRRATTTEEFSAPPGHPLSHLQDRLARMEPRLARMEQFVTSSDFMLERQFRDLERSAERQA